MKNRSTYLTKTVFSVIFIAITLVVWQIVALIVNDDFAVPSLLSVGADMLKIFYVPSFSIAYFSTLLRAFIGFALSFIMGVLLAVVAKKFAFIKGLCVPLVSVIRLIPTMAIASLLCITLSPSVASVAVCFTVVMPYVYSSAQAMLESVGDELLEMAKVYGVPHGRVLSGIYLPTVKKPLVELLGTAFSFALKITVSSEVVTGALKSMGGLINTAQNVYLSPSLVVAVTVWVVVTGLFAELITHLVATLLDKRRRA